MEAMDPYTHVYMQPEAAVRMPSKFDGQLPVRKTFKPAGFLTSGLHDKGFRVNSYCQGLLRSYNPLPREKCHREMSSVSEHPCGTVKNSVNESLLSLPADHYANTRTPRYGPKEHVKDVWILYSPPALTTPDSLHKEADAVALKAEDEKSAFSGQKLDNPSGPCSVEGINGQVMTRARKRRLLAEEAGKGSELLSEIFQPGKESSVDPSHDSPRASSCSVRKQLLNSSEEQEGSSAREKLSRRPTRQLKKRTQYGSDASDDPGCKPLKKRKMSRRR
ncbi:uncharacterized protein [Hoplias malabaricus]|uniref:uncharacterized protein n=1 Tax=Hoplias malabaricus TaxID=27720 RepID=UPI0034623F6E